MQIVFYNKKIKHRTLSIIDSGKLEHPQNTATHLIVSWNCAYIMPGMLIDAEKIGHRWAGI
jgi:hypothetical protein